jgi:hypothetical protein
MTNKQTRTINRDLFLARLKDEFPEVLELMNQYDAGLIHCEIAKFRRATEQAIDASQLWITERHFKFVEESLASADAELRNALVVSYLEDFALGDWSAAPYQAVKERMPKHLRTILIQHSKRWQ